MADFIVNKAGAKVYLDANKHELLEIPVLKNVEERGVIHQVLSVGIGRQRIPTITIRNPNKKALVYRLPMELQEWAQASITTAMRVPKLFPTNVEFGKIDDTIYAHFL